ncbi:Imm8 family immunity protein [Mesorhizobium sp. ANAO-SY3R2]|uniref:Imm8 family immunity protein n=1 Tax=Mesorhizobium sp. ANAO-SY3R2 TaxID=3166644 RepID=UPI003670E42C
MKAQYMGHRLLEVDGSRHDFDDNLANLTLNDPEYFVLDIDFYAGLESGDALGAFTLRVCSPKWFVHNCRGVQPGKHMLFMPRFDAASLEQFIESYCADTEGETWEAVALKLHCLGSWEFVYRT